MLGVHAWGAGRARGGGSRLPIPTTGTHPLRLAIDGGTGTSAGVRMTSRSTPPNAPSIPWSGNRLLRRRDHQAETAEPAVADDPGTWNSAGKPQLHVPERMLREPGTVRETLGHRSSALEGLALHADVGRSRPHPGGIVEPVAVVGESAGAGWRSAASAPRRAGRHRAGRRDRPAGSDAAVRRIASPDLSLRADRRRRPTERLTWRIDVLQAGYRMRRRMRTLDVRTRHGAVSYFASGCGRTWNFTAFCSVPGPPSRCHAA